jgi:hypothetical protein
MKLITFFCFLSISYTTFCQHTFRSSYDVLNYLTEKNTFTNKNANFSIYFSEYELRAGSNAYTFQDANIININRALIKYSSVYTGNSIQLIVDCRENLLVDVSDKSVYRPYSFEEPTPPAPTPKPSTKQPPKKAPPKKAPPKKAPVKKSGS